MSERNYKELWGKLKVVIVFSKQKRYTPVELLKLMIDLEVSQLAPDPFAALLGVMEGAKEVKK